MGLEKYREKRDLTHTPEPAGGQPSAGLPRFVVQLHRASHLHYDFRLESESVLKSWAVPKGPSMNPDDKRLAMMVEDHPMDYRLFEGIIPKGNYGAGTVMVWDEGVFVAPDSRTPDEVEQAVRAGLHKGHVVVFLDGKKLRGLFDLIKLKGREENAWLLVKREDEFASREPATPAEETRSVLTSRSLAEIRESAPASGHVWTSGEGPTKSVDVGDAPEASMPHKVKPMLATEVDRPFNREGWLFEVKWDGYRAIAEVERAGEIRLYSRNGLSFTERYPEIVSALRSLGHAAVLDGEIVAVDEQGASQFQWLQDYAKGKRGSLLYYLFDILYLDGRDLRTLPLAKRKEILREIVPEGGRLRFSDHVEERGVDFFEAIKAQNLEGVLAKNGACPYEAGRRSPEWKKVKWLQDQLAVIGGYTEPRNSRKHFGALVVGVYDGDDLLYIGHTGGGFDERTLNHMMDLLEPLKSETCPFASHPKTNMPVTWVEPRLVCEVTFRGWTDSGLLRQPVFKQMVPGADPLAIHRGMTLTDIDQDASDIERAPDAIGIDAMLPSISSGEDATLAPEVSGHSSSADGPKTKLIRFPPKSREQLVEIDGHSLKLTNLDKVLWPDDGYTKGDLIAYYRAVADFILPYLRNRPESLHRHPNGVGTKAFFQKAMPDSIPDWLETVPVDSDRHGGKINYLLCQNEATLVYMANLACIEINPWNSSMPHLDRPDYTVVDLDPHEVGFDAVIESARVVKHVLDELGVVGLPKTSGSTGIHIFIPLGAEYSIDQATQFAHVVASLVHQRLPDITSLERMPARRVGKVYLDFLQNRDGQTLAAAYSVRPKPGATVSTPLHWDEVNKTLDLRRFTIRTVLDRLESVGDLWSPVLGSGVDLAAALSRLT